MVVLEDRCALFLGGDAGSLPTEAQLQKRLESASDEDKVDDLCTIYRLWSSQIEALSLVIRHMSQGETFPRLLMPIIKGCLTSSNHILKKHVVRLSVSLFGLCAHLLLQYHSCSIGTQ